MLDGEQESRGTIFGKLFIIIALTIPMTDIMAEDQIFRGCRPYDVGTGPLNVVWHPDGRMSVVPSIEGWRFDSLFASKYPDAMGRPVNRNSGHAWNMLWAFGETPQTGGGGATVFVSENVADGGRVFAYDKSNAANRHYRQHAWYTPLGFPDQEATWQENIIMSDSARKSRYQQLSNGLGSPVTEMLLPQEKNGSVRHGRTYLPIVGRSGFGGVDDIDSMRRSELASRDSGCGSKCKFTNNPVWKGKRSGQTRYVCPDATAALQNGEVGVSMMFAGAGLFTDGLQRAGDSPIEGAVLTTAGTYAVAGGTTMVLSSGATLTGSTAIGTAAAGTAAIAAPAAAAVGSVTVAGAGMYQMYQQSPSKGYSPDDGYSSGYFGAMRELYWDPMFGN